MSLANWISSVGWSASETVELGVSDDDSDEDAGVVEELSGVVEELTGVVEELSGVVEELWEVELDWADDVASVASDEVYNEVCGGPTLEEKVSVSWS